MKLLLLLLSFLFSSSNNASNEISDFSLMGTWKNDTFSIEYSFENDSTAYFEQGGFGTMTKYKMDDSKTPIWIDFETTMGKNSITIPGLMQIIHKDTIVIEQFSPGSNHPSSFTQEDGQLNNKHTLYRKK